MPPTPVGELTRASGLRDGGVAGTSCVKGCDRGGVPGITLSTEDPRGLAVKPGGVLGDISMVLLSFGDPLPGYFSLSVARKVPERRDMDKHGTEFVLCPGC